MINARARGSQPRVSERKIWIERDRLNVKLFGGAVILQKCVGLELVPFGLQIKIVSLSVVGWFVVTRWVSSGVSVGAQGRCNFAGDLSVDA